MLTAIVAYNANFVIGNKAGEIPWKIKDEMRHFRDTTMGSPCIMGRKTWDTIPVRFRPLTGRTNIVVTRKPGALAQEVCEKFMPSRRVIEGPFFVESFDAAVALAKRFLTDKIFVIGGAQIYDEAIRRGLVSEVIASEVAGYTDVEGAAFFTLPKNWEKRVLREHEEFSIVEYTP